ncbi:MAG: hypothetical protein GY814_16425 [Gammaproteobacteria bacterium]|nr:hypothetical protein [Gammaproteobacteria bacterium]
MMRQAAKITDTGVSAEELRQFRIRLGDEFDGNSQFSEGAGLDEILNVYLQFLQSQLLGSSDHMDIGKVREMLLEVTALVRAGKVKDRGEEFGRFMDGLVNIYRFDTMESGGDGFQHSVGDYAELLMSVSSEFPAYNYDAALQQLFLYMNRMFEHQQKGWVEVLESIASMPESIGFVRPLKQECFPEIMEWVEGGVQNLFQIRGDLSAMLRKLNMREQLVEQQMARLQNAYQTRQTAENLIDLKQGKKVRAMVLLRRKLVAIRHESAEKIGMIKLVESNIQEFQDLMVTTRRAFFIRLVPDAAI